MVPRRTDRAFLCGQTGSGKTTLARVLLDTRTYVAVLDVKLNLAWPGYRVIKKMSDLDKVDPVEDPKIIFRPSLDDMDNISRLDRFFAWVYDRGNTTCYVDEVFGVTKGQQLPRMYGACLTRGREFSVEMWSASQRPKDIPSVVMSEAEHVYAFRLRMPQDRVRIEDLTAIPQQRIAALSKREFLYAPQDGDIEGPLFLDFVRQSNNNNRTD
jgi:hypothetical protein